MGNACDIRSLHFGVFLLLQAASNEETCSTKMSCCVFCTARGKEGGDGDVGAPCTSGHSLFALCLLNWPFQSQPGPCAYVCARLSSCDVVVPRKRRRTSILNPRSKGRGRGHRRALGSNTRSNNFPHLVGLSSPARSAGRAGHKKLLSGPLVHALSLLISVAWV